MIDDIVLHVGHRDPVADRVAGDVACARAVARRVEQLRGAMVAEVAGVIVQHRQERNPAMIQAAAAALEVQPMVLAAQVAAIELRRERKPHPLVSWGRRD